MNRLEVVTNEFKGIRLDVYLSELLDEWTRSSIKRQIDNGGVLINGKKTKAGYLLREGDEITIDFVEDNRLDDVLPENIPLDVVYEDRDIVVINKPQGMVVHPAPGSYNGTLVNALLYKFGEMSDINGKIRPGIVHRIDKDTSGLLVVAKNNSAHEKLAKQIAVHSCFRKYIALLEGVVKQDEGTIKTFIARDPKDRKKMAVTSAGREAISHYKVLERYANYTLMSFQLETGRTHQIRVHSKHIGHPIVGDKTYGFIKQKFSLNGQLLHAKELELTHPVTGERMTFYAEIPEYFKNVLKKLEKTKIDV